MKCNHGTYRTMSSELSVSIEMDMLEERSELRPSFPSVCIFMKKSWWFQASSPFGQSRPVHVESSRDTLRLLLGDCIWCTYENGGNHNWFIQRRIGLPTLCPHKRRVASPLIHLWTSEPLETIRCEALRWEWEIFSIAPRVLEDGCGL